MSPQAHRAGFAAILGPPNSGKSTLLNRLLGEKLAIVSRKPQTTRSRILGILSRDDAQLLFLDTPGFHASPKAFNETLNDQVVEAAQGCDVALLLVDLCSGWSEGHADLKSRLSSAGKPVIVVGSKLDLPGAKDGSWPPPQADRALRVSALTGEGLPKLLSTVVELLPESPPLYPRDEISDRPLRFLVAELVREAAFEVLSQELPYSLAVEVVDFDESRPDLTRIRAELLVERNSQKPIVVGRGGTSIRKIGTRARREIERLVDGRVHLELWVKVEPRWSRSAARIRGLGYN